MKNEQASNDLPHNNGDLDFVVVVSESAVPFLRSAPSWGTTTPPILAELPIYTGEKWQRPPGIHAQYARVLETEAAWFYST